MKTTPAPLSRFSARLEPAATAMVWWEPGRRLEPMAVLEVPLRPGDSLVTVELSTICRSDLAMIHGDLSASAPLVLGHESVGRVVTAGSEAVDVDGEPLRCGDRVVWSIAAPCGACADCARGAWHDCLSAREYGHERVRAGWELSGAFATHIHLRAGTDIVKSDAAVPAVLLAPLGCNVAAGRPALPGTEPASDLRSAVRQVERAWRHLPSRELTAATLPLSRVDEALALAETDDRARVGVDPRS
ncbi:alcohol dehydrogenase catalytic domain-containing protein [Microbacterium rhizosphaerae]|uniref:alcohol dehydrogenase n=1 Tax=Microbacterium rhizosphaerae TaxID=1678237 RepID=A0ABZ0SQ81_9MICO|nr:alcohol dehydrogenase catalytic domain-containing protein [Microbacterium rhizosphaerae]WPR90350.1 alcohol dehydrogenase catalytic domain-containing protein [Microbacterium rhizosphaerae]